MRKIQLQHGSGSTRQLGRDGSSPRWQRLARTRNRLRKQLPGFRVIGNGHGCFFACLFQRQHQERLFHFFRFESKRPTATFVRDSSVRVDDIKPSRHSAVGISNGVVDVIDQQWHRRIQFRRTLFGHSLTLFEGRWLSNRDAYFVVRLHRPSVGGMSFANVNHQEVGVVFLTFSHRFDGRISGSKRTAGEVAKDQNHRFPADSIRQTNRFTAAQRTQLKIRSHFINVRTFLQRTNLSGHQSFDQSLLARHVTRREPAARRYESIAKLL